MAINMTALDSVKTKIDSVEFTRIVGPITVEAIDNLKLECAEASSKVKTSLWARGNEFGHLALIASQDEYRGLIADPLWVYAMPVTPGPFDTTITGATSAAQTVQGTTVHKIKK